MSRGPGRLQNAVIDHLRGAAAEVTFESLRWTLWLESGEAPTAQDPDLPNSANTSIKRAVDGLEKDGRIVVDRRKLVSFEEAVSEFPHKTLQGATRRLRLELLPVLLKGVQDGEAFPRYNPADNERFHLESLSPDEHDSLRESWLRIEPRLIDLLPKAKRADRNALFTLIAKGKAVFEIRALECRQSFAEYLRDCLDRQVLPEPLAGEVREFSDFLVPPTDAGHLKLKGFVHFFAHVPRHRGCTLKTDTLDFLSRARPDVVQNLPGYVPRPEPPAGRYAFHTERKETHSPELVGLFDQTVFQAFNFLRLA